MRIRPLLTKSISLLLSGLLALPNAAGATSQLRQLEIMQNPEAKAGLEDRLSSSSNQGGMSRRQFVRGFLMGGSAAIATAIGNELRLSQQGPAGVAPPVPQPGPDRLLPGNAPPQGDPSLQELFPGLDSESLQRETGRFFDAVRLSQGFRANNGVRIPAGMHRSYLPDLANPGASPFLAGYPRFWVYDDALAVYYRNAVNQPDQARAIVDGFVQIADQERAGGFRGLWRFSYGTDYVDPRAPMGAVGWVFKSIYAHILATGDARHLAWTSDRLQELLFDSIHGLQVMDPQDPRYGLILAGYTGEAGGKEEAGGQKKQQVSLENEFYTGSPLGWHTGFHRWEDSAPESAKMEVFNQKAAAVQRGGRPGVAPHVILEHQWNFSDALRLAYYATQRFAPEGQAKRDFLAKLVQRHDLLMTKIREKFFIDGNPGEARFVTSMDGDGRVNRSEAWDNTGWGSWDAYDPEIAWKMLQRLDRRFTRILPASSFQGAVAGQIRPGERVKGLIFFTGTFQDPYVPANPDFERLLQPEATFGAIWRFMDFATWTPDPQRKQWAIQKATELMLGGRDGQGEYGGMRRFLELYSTQSLPGYPYATLNIQDFFSTLRSTAANGPAGMVSAGLRGANIRNFIGVIPPPEMTVGGRAPVRRLNAGMEERKSLWLGVAAGFLGFILPYAGWRMSSPPAVPVPQEPAPVQPVPIQPAPAQPEPVPVQPAPIEPPPVQKEEAPAPGTLQKAVVTPETVRVRLPKSLAGNWVVALLKTDQWYLQGQPLQVPADGMLEFSVQDYKAGSLAFPGWVDVNGGMLAVFSTRTSAESLRQARTAGNIRGTVVLFRFMANGTMLIERGALPGHPMPVAKQSGMEEAVAELIQLMTAMGETVPLLLMASGGAVPLHEVFSGQRAVTQLAGPKGALWTISGAPMAPADLERISVLPVFIQPEFREQVENQLQSAILTESNKKGWIRLADTVLEKGALVIGNKGYRDHLGEIPQNLGQIYLEVDEGGLSLVTPDLLARLLINLAPVPGEVLKVRGSFEQMADGEEASLISA